MDTTPCLGCRERAVGCHATCMKYKIYDKMMVNKRGRRALEVSSFVKQELRYHGNHDKWHSGYENLRVTRIRNNKRRRQK